jgi:hypothetical protein
MRARLSKPAAVAVVIYVSALVLCGLVFTLTVSDSETMALYGWIFALPWIAILPPVGHAYYADAMNAITLYTIVALYAARRPSKKPKSAVPREMS